MSAGRPRFPRRSLVTAALVDDRRVLLGWVATLPGFALLYAGLYPSLRNGAMTQAMSALPPSLRQGFGGDDLSSAAGYLGSTTFGILVPLLGVVYGASSGSRVLAGQEETGLLDLVLAHPVRRESLVLQRFAALAIGGAAMVGAVLGALLAVRAPLGLTGVTPGQLAAQCLQLWLLVCLSCALALALSAATGSRAAAFAGTAVLGVLSYVANAFGPALGAGWLRRVSAFRYYIGGHPLREGFVAGDAAVLVAATAVLLGVAVLALRRRDLAV